MQKPSCERGGLEGHPHPASPTGGCLKSPLLSPSRRAWRLLEFGLISQAIYVEPLLNASPAYEVGGRRLYLLPPKEPNFRGLRRW